MLSRADVVKLAGGRDDIFLTHWFIQHANSKYKVPQSEWNASSKLLLTLRSGAKVEGCEPELLDLFRRRWREVSVSRPVVGDHEADHRRAVQGPGTQGAQEWVAS